MRARMKLYFFLFFIITFISPITVAQAFGAAISEYQQTSQTEPDNRLFQQAEKLRKEYRFQDAIKIYKSISDSSAAIIKSIAISENGISMLKYAARPVVTGKESLPATDFFLYTPGLGDRKWVEAPENFTSYNLLPDSLRSDTPMPMLYSENQTAIYFSVQETQRGWTIYSSRLVDGTTWSTPEPLNDLVNSSGDEIFPYVSRSGRELYFASNGHPGVGGFDLFVSTWNDKDGDWGAPQNLGFPYSSPEDDFLFINDDNALFSYLFSNRNSGTNVSIFRLNYEPTPIRRPVSSAEEAATIAALNVATDESVEKNQEDDQTGKALITNPETQEYATLIKNVRAIQKSIDSLSSAIAVNRRLYLSITNESERNRVEKEISGQEFELISRQSALSSMNKELQKRETDFLTNGTIIPRDIKQPSLPPDKPHQPEISFKPEKSGWGYSPQIDFLEPVKKIDYTFRIGGEPEIIEEVEVPLGLIYRIQLFVVRDKVLPIALKNISPIFETKAATDRWLYSAGQFYTEQEASAALAQIKRAGFPNAVLIAYNNGKSITISAARNLVKEIEANVSYQIVLENFPEGLPPTALIVLRENTDRDIAKSVVDGKEVYIVGPFSNRAEAEKIVLLLTNSDLSGITIQEIKSSR